MTRPMTSQTTSRIQVAVARLYIMAAEITMPMIGVNGTHGVTKARFTSVPRARNTQTPAHTMMNASKVPMETIWPSTSIGVRAPARATQMPTKIVERYGVRKRGCTLLAHAGSRPSLDIEKKTRDCPSNITTIVLLNPQIAPSLTTMLPQRTPVTSMPMAIGSGTSRLVYLTNPVSTAATRMYRTVQTASDPRMPMGMSRAGFFASWAAVDTASKPMYAKNMMPAAVAIPEMPNSP